MDNNTNTNDYNNLLELLLDIAEALVYAGAEISRVEDTVMRMGKAYGAKKIDIFALPSVLFLTASFYDGSSHTQTRRVLSAGQNNFEKIDKLNALSRKCCASPITREELKCEIESINNNSVHKTNIYIGSILAAAGFAVFFGGNIADALVSGIFAILICLISDYLSPRMPNRVFYYFITSLIVGFGICSCAKCLPVLNANNIIIGDIMVLVPGIAITGAVKNMLIGDTLSALVRVTECLVWTAALAIGFMIPISVLLGG